MFLDKFKALALLGDNFFTGKAAKPDGYIYLNLISISKVVIWNSYKKLLLLNSFEM